MRDMEWALPEWTALDLWRCRVGRHLATRKRVVWGYSGFSAVERHYCACGRTCWIKFEGSFVDTKHTEPGGHHQWIASAKRLEAEMASQQAKIDRLRAVS